MSPESGPSPESRLPNSRATILAAGFKGLHTVEAIHSGQFASIGDVPGIYGVFRLSDPHPRFSLKSAAARWKGQDPTIGVPALQAAWLNEAALLYVDKGASLRTRVRQLVEFGHGKQVAHWGGRALWQLSDADDLVVGWRPAENPKAAEAELLADFAAVYGTRPWANALDKA